MKKDKLYVVRIFDFCIGIPEILRILLIIINKRYFLHKNTVLKKYKADVRMRLKFTYSIKRGKTFEI